MLALRASNGAEGVIQGREKIHGFMRIVSLILLLSLVSAASAEQRTLRGATMGTTYHIRFVSAAVSVDVEQLQADVESVLAEIDRQMSTYRTDSELSRFNRSEAGEWFAVSPPVVQLVKTARAISEQTEGALDVTVGPLVRLWHFGPKNVDGDGGKNQFEPPSEAMLKGARRSVGYRKLETREEPAALRKAIAGLEVDLSSVAAGYAVDRLAELLRRRGIENFMVEIGGEILARGKREDGQPWRVAIERPAFRGRKMQAAVPLVDAAISTAGDYRKYFEHHGRRYSHIIDPSTGRPIEQQLASVTVVADTCLMADAWDTPLLVLGPERGYDCAERHGIAALFISLHDNREQLRATSAWRARFPQETPRR